MALTIEAVKEFIEMADRAEKVYWSGADNKDIFDFIYGSYDEFKQKYGFEVDWEWFDFYQWESRYRQNAENLKDEINKKADSLRKLLAAINEE